MNRYLRATLIAPLTAPLLYWAGRFVVATADPAQRAYAGQNVLREMFVTVAWGAPFAYLATLALGLPALWLLRRFGPLTFERTVTVGLAAGLVAGILLEPRLRTDLIRVPLGAWQGAILGAGSAAVWWLLAQQKGTT